MDKVFISDIKLTKKGRYALFCGAEFLFSVDELTLRKYHVEIGSGLHSDEILQMRRDSDYNKAYTKALDFLAMRDHSEKELREKLMRKFDEDTARAATDKMKEIGYLSDEVFAKKYAAELIERRGASKRETENKLRQKGIDRETAAEVVAEFDEDETAQIKEIIEKKYIAKLQSKNGTAAVFNTLMRKGFLARDIRNALRGLDVEVYEEY